MKSTLEKIVFVLVALLCLLGVYFSRTDLNFFEKTYIREDGLIEWLTVLGLALGAFICFYRSRVLAPFRDKIFLWALIFQGLVFVFGVGEEISWGQRLIGFDVPSFFAEHNAQRETNIHNMIVSGKSVNRILFGLILGITIGFYFVVAPILYSKVDRVKEIINRFAIPIPKLAHVLAYVALFVAVQLIPGKRSGEILEFGGVWIFILMIYNPLNREVFSRKSFER